MICNIAFMRSPLTRYRKENALTLEALAVQFGAHKTTVMRWEEDRVPVERVLDVERITGISRHDLRPDIFGPPPAQASTEAA